MDSCQPYEVEVNHLKGIRPLRRMKDTFTSCSLCTLIVTDTVQISVYGVSLVLRALSGTHDDL